MWQWVMTCCGLCGSDSGAESGHGRKTKSDNGTQFKYGLDPANVDIDIDMNKRSAQAVSFFGKEHAAKRSKAMLSNSFTVLEREFKNRGYDDTAIASMRSVFSWVCDSATEISVQPSLYPGSEDKISNIEDDPEYREWLARLADFNDTQLFFDESDGQATQDKLEHSGKRLALPANSPHPSPGQDSIEQGKDASRVAVDTLELERPESLRAEELVALELYTQADEQQVARREAREHAKQVAIAERIVIQTQERTLSQSATESSPDRNPLVVLRQEHESEGENASYAPSSANTL